MKLQRISITGFRSFHENQVLLLHKMNPGLWLVTGENQVEPELGANGAGKSSLFEAVHWAIRGLTSRKLKASAIQAWDTELPTEVSLIMLEENKVKTLKRTQAPNELTWDGEIVDQARVDHLFAAEVMTNTWYFPQFTQAFIDLKPEARMEIYTEVMALGLWDEKSELAKTVADAYKEEAAAKTLEVTKWQTELDTLRSIDYTAHKGEWDKLYQERKVTIAKKAMEVKNRLVATNTLLLKMRKKDKEDEVLQNAYDEEKSKLQAKVDMNNRALSTWVANLDRTDSEVAQLQKDKAKTDKGTCPTCGQRLHTRNAAETIKTKIALLEFAGKDQSKAVLKFRLAVKEAMDTLRALEKPRLSNAHEQVIVLSERKAQLERELQNVAREKKEEKNPFIHLERKRKEQIKTCLATLNLRKRERKEAEDMQAKSAFWIKGFKEIRYQVMQDSLVQLNTEVNESLHQLGLQDWEIIFSAEKENKSGTVKRGFLCSVRSPHTSVAVPWEAWSGGESQRLRLAAQFGISNLLVARSGFNPSVEFWDEPTQFLSDGGVTQLLEQLEDRAKRYKRVILLADHRSLDYSFEGTVHITKTAEGSTIETRYQV